MDFALSPYFYPYILIWYICVTVHTLDVKLLFNAIYNFVKFGISFNSDWCCHVEHYLVDDSMEIKHEILFV